MDATGNCTRLSTTYTRGTTSHRRGIRWRGADRRTVGSNTLRRRTVVRVCETRDPNVTVSRRLSVAQRCRTPHTMSRSDNAARRMEPSGPGAIVVSRHEVDPATGRLSPKDTTGPAQRERGATGRAEGGRSGRRRIPVCVRGISRRHRPVRSRCHSCVATTDGDGSVLYGNGRSVR